jgi:hypothetical protein
VPGLSGARVGVRGRDGVGREAGEEQHNEREHLMAGKGMTDADAKALAGPAMTVGELDAIKTKADVSG